MKKRTLIVSAALAAMSALGGVKDEVHGYTPKGYVQPKEPEVRERLEWFKDQKLALMMCLGLYSDIGIKESWPLCDSKAGWSRVEVDWTADVDEFKRQYFGLIRSFNRSASVRRHGRRPRRTTASSTFSSPRSSTTGSVCTTRSTPATR